MVFQENYAMPRPCAVITMPPKSFFTSSIPKIWEQVRQHGIAVNLICQPHTVISRNPKYFFGAKISIRFLLKKFFSRLVRFSIGEKSLPYFFEAARKNFPFFLRRLEKVSLLFEAARKKFPFFLRRLEKSFLEHCKQYKMK